MSSYIRRIALLTATVFLAACDAGSAVPTSPHAPPRAIPATPSSSVERSYEEWVSDFEGVTAYFICADGTESEGVALEGYLYNRNATVATPAGSYIMTSHTLAKGLRGTGTVTGQEYRVREQDLYAVNQREVGYAGAHRHLYELTGTVTMETFKLMVIQHWVITPDGKYVVEREEVRSECAK